MLCIFRLDCEPLYPYTVCFTFTAAAAVCRRRAVAGVQQSLLHPARVRGRSPLRRPHSDAAQRRRTRLRPVRAPALLHRRSAEEAAEDVDERDRRRGGGRLAGTALTRGTRRRLDRQAAGLTFL